MKTMKTMKRSGRTIALAAALALTAVAVPPAAAGAAQEEWTFSLQSKEVQPGGEINAFADVRVCKDHGGPGPVTSPGFTAPITWGSSVGAAGGSFGKTTAIDTPGKYLASMKCLDGQSRPDVEFTILGQIPTTPTTPTTPSTTEPPAPPTTKPAPPPIRKPKGAPETGGGGTA